MLRPLGAALGAFRTLLARYGGPSRTLGTELGEVRAKKFARIAEFPAVKSFIGTHSPPSCPLLAARFRSKVAGPARKTPLGFARHYLNLPYGGPGPGPGLAGPGGCGLRRISRGSN